VVVGGADELHRKDPVSGRDIVDALAASLLAEVDFERLTIRPRVRDIDL
jgi:hypothetical protein